MGKRKLKASLLLAVLLLLGACQKEGEEGSDSSSQTIVNVDSLSEAIENTSEYALSIQVDEETDYLFGVYSEDFYYYAPNTGGYLRYEDDPDYYHAYATETNEDSIYSLSLDVYGRNFLTRERDDYFSVDFLDILRTYADDFYQVDERAYACSLSKIAAELKNYFQNRSFVYANYFVAEVGLDGRLSSFYVYERSGSDILPYNPIVFERFDKEAFAPYKEWKENGSPINLRIYDLKTGSTPSYASSSFVLCYEGERVTFQGTVSSFDNEGNYFVSSEDERNGYIGIKVKPLKEGDLPKINEVVEVSGYLSKSNYCVAHIEEATFTKVGEATYYPLFDEEPIATMYGAGYYAAYLFSQAPYFAGSVYSTYAYVASLPEKAIEGRKTTIPLICPDFTYSSGECFEMALVLPASLGADKSQKILDQLEEYGVYGQDGAKEISFERFLVSFNIKSKYTAQIVYASESSFSLALSPAEKVMKDYGLASFPFPEAETYSCYHFGGSSGTYIEEIYGKSGQSQLGIYYYAPELSEDDVSKMASGLTAIGFSLSDVIKDSYSRRHHIYKNGDLIVDYCVVDSTFGDEVTLNVWIYRGDLIYESTIQEILEEKEGFSDFVMLAGSYSADYTFYSLPNFAGRKYEQGHYLSCVTLDIKGEGYSELIKRYINEKGFTTYRNADNTPYSYRTRGQNHYVIYKDIEGSDEKLFLDMACYPTSDYTFLGHSSFDNRIEMLVYKGKEPLSTLYQNDLNEFFAIFNEQEGFDTSSLPSFALPSDSKIEMVYNLDPNGMEQYNYTYYGYYSALQAFLYTSDVSGAYAALVEGLKQDGFIYYSTSPKGNDCYYKEGGEGGFGSFILLMKQGSYIRILGDMGGVDF